MKLAAPYALLLLIPLAALLIYKLNGRKRRPAVALPTLSALKGVRPSWRVRLRRLPLILRMSALVLFVLALARPQSYVEKTKVESEGIDIVLVMDVSGSMRCMDFEPNRLEVVRRLAQYFVAGRTGDRVGLVLFASDAFTQCPLTVDYDVLNEVLGSADFARSSSTAIGVALATGVNALRDSKAKSKVVILLTDGQNNAGRIQPLDAAKIAKEMGVKVYTIGIGKPGPVECPVGRNIFGRPAVQTVEVSLDEGLLQHIAEITGGRFFRATDARALKRIYDDISKMEKTKTDVTVYRRYKELFVYPLIFGVLFLVAEGLLGATILRRLV